MTAHATEMSTKPLPTKCLVASLAPSQPKKDTHILTALKEPEKKTLVSTAGSQRKAQKLTSLSSTPKTPISATEDFMVNCPQPLAATPVAVVFTDFQVIPMKHKWAYKSG